MRSIKGQPFGQKEKLTRRLHNILREYPAGSQLFELLQNADDARATEVINIYSIY